MDSVRILYDKIRLNLINHYLQMTCLDQVG
uniref:BLTX426 n=1 Tax=Nephila pilipes TaxID=299642 RepID=A0A076L2F7_NEPPI|nr:BLTX426 [Nephila pilipes]